MRVLLTGGGGAAAPAFLQWPTDILHLADADPDVRPWNCHPDRWHVLPRATDPDFVPTLRLLCQRYAIDLLVPGVDEEIRPILAADWPCPVLLPTSPIAGGAAFAQMHTDKLFSCSRLQALGLPVPATDRVRFRAQAGIVFPCILKPRFGRGSRDVVVVRDDEDIAAHLRLTGQTREDFVVQTLLTGPEYTATVVADRQCRVRAVVAVRVLEKRGITRVAEIDQRPEVLDWCTRFHAREPFCGVVNVQGRLTDEGFLVFEINPRISTTACLAQRAGVDLFRLFLDEGPVQPVPVQTGLRMVRSWWSDYR